MPVFSDLYVPLCMMFQVECDIAFNDTSYYILIFDTICSPNPVSVFWKAALFVFYSQNPEIQ